MVTGEKACKQHKACGPPVLLDSTITFTYSYVLCFWKHSAHGLKVENLAEMSPQVTVIEILLWQEQLHWAGEEQHFFSIMEFRFVFILFLVLSDSGTLPWDLSKQEKLAATYFS